MHGTNVKTKLDICIKTKRKTTAYQNKTFKNN